MSIDDSCNVSLVDICIESIVYSCNVESGIVSIVYNCNVSIDESSNV